MASQYLKIILAPDGLTSKESRKSISTKSLHNVNRSARVTCSAAQSSSDANAYLSWAESAGIQSGKITQAYFGDLRGAKALEPIQPEEPFITVPRNSALVVGPKDRCPCPEFVDPSFWTPAPWYVKMAVLLLSEKQKGSSSAVSGYIAQLPTTIDTPVRWTDEELQELQYPPLEDDVKRQRQQWRDYHTAFVKAAGAGAPKDWESFLWAIENVRSRSFSGPYAGAPLAERARAAAIVAAAGVAYVAWAHVPLVQALNGAIAAAIFNLMYDILLSQKLKWYALLPVIDTVNHNSAVESSIEFEYFKGDFAASVSNRSYQPGEQVYISYGAQSNSSLMQYYGFVESGNPNDIYVFNTTLAGQPIKATLTGKGTFSPETLAEAKSALGSSSSDIQIQSALLTAVEAEYDSKPTNIGEDKRLLQTSHLMSERARAAVAFRMEKKHILEICMKKMRKRIAKKLGD